MSFKQFLVEEEKKKTKYHKVFISSKKPKDKYHKMFISSKKKKRRGKQVDEKFDWGQQQYSHDIQQKGSKNVVQSPFKGASPKDVKDNVLTKAHWVDQHKEKPFNSEEREGIKRYTGHEHHEVNGNLFKGKPHNADHAFIDNHLSSAIKKRTAPKNMTVFSGMRSPENLPVHKGSGHILIHNPAYTSTTVSAATGKDFGGQKTQEGTASKHTYWSTDSHWGNPPTGKSKYKPQTQFNPNKHKAWKSPEKGATFMEPVHKDMPSHVTVSGNHGSWSNQNQGGHWKVYKHVVQVHVPKGSHGIYTGANSEYDNEKEYILHKDAKIAVHPTPEIDHENKVVKWKGKLVHDGIKPTRHGVALGLHDRSEVPREPEQKRFDFGPNKNPAKDPGKEKIIAQKKALKSKTRQSSMEKVLKNISFAVNKT
jgi:hypothetical protein